MSEQFSETQPEGPTFLSRTRDPADPTAFTEVWETTTGIEVEIQGCDPSGRTCYPLEETLKLRTAESDGSRWIPGN